MGWVRQCLLMLVALGCSVAVFLLVNYFPQFQRIDMSKNPQTLDYIEMQTGIDPKISVIWLHGLGADGHDFESVVPELRLPNEPAIRFIFPHAPMRPITVNNGLEMRGWYDVYEVPIEPGKIEAESIEHGQTIRQDREGLDQSAGIVSELIEQENQRGISTNNIFLVGFSQGGAIALFAGLRYPETLRGIIALSTYLPVAESLESERAKENLNTPIFMAHGNQDPVIPVAAGDISYSHLQTLGYDIKWHTYEMPHSIHPDEIRDISNFIQAQL